jgi:hypothetical protein
MIASITADCFQPTRYPNPRKPVTPSEIAIGTRKTMSTKENTKPMAAMSMHSSLRALTGGDEHDLYPTIHVGQDCDWHEVDSEHPHG